MGLLYRISCIGRKFASGFMRIESTFLIVAYGLIPVFIVVEVISRYVMRAAITGIEEATLLVVAYAYYIGAAYAAKKRNHITVRILHLIPVSNDVIKLIKCVSDILSLACASLITYFMIKYFVFVAASPSLYTPFTFRKYYYVAGPTIGWVLVFFYSLESVIETMKEYSEGRKEK